MGKRIWAIVSIIMVLFLFSGCASPAQDVLKAVDDGRYIDANEIFNEKVIGQLKEEKLVTEGLNERIDNIVSSYNEESLTFDDALSALEWIEKCGVCDSQILLQANQTLRRLAASKQEYKKGVERFEESDYHSAYTSFGSVSSIDSKYDDAQEKMKQSKTLFIQQLEGLVKDDVAKKQYTTAANRISDALAFFVQDPEIEKMEKEFETSYANYYIGLSDDHISQKKYEEAVKDVKTGVETLGQRTDLQKQLEKATSSYIDDVLQEAGKKASQLKYVEAIQLMNKAFSLVGNDNRLLSPLENYKKKYVDDTVQRAEKAFAEARESDHFVEENCYGAAIKVIQEALGVLGQDNTLQSEIDYYRSFEPISLLSLPPSKKGNCLRIGNNYKLTQRFGLASTDSVVLYPSTDETSLLVSTSGETRDNTVEFYLDAEYAAMKGQLLHRGTDRLLYPEQFKVYGDGRLLYEAPSTISEARDPINFAIDVSGVTKLEICIIGLGESFDTLLKIYESPEPSIVASELLIQKKGRNVNESVPKSDNNTASVSEANQQSAQQVTAENPSKLSFEDFWGTGDTFPNGKNFLQELWDTEGLNARWYTVNIYDTAVDSSKYTAVCTARGIHLGDTKEAVIAAYGAGDAASYDPNAIARIERIRQMYDGLPCSSQITYYDTADNGSIRFYFTADNKVEMIIYFSYCDVE